MTKIIDLFRDKEQVSNIIQQVIDYKSKKPEELKREIDEYVVTDHIQESLDNILEWIRRVSENPGVETGAWISGFYGSGKSSFSKYLGYSFNRSLVVDGVPFVDRFADRIGANTTRQSLKTLSRQLDAAVIMMDLASQTDRKSVV